jgi:hypothetical protein
MIRLIPSKNKEEISSRQYFSCRLDPFGVESIRIGRDPTSNIVLGDKFKKIPFHLLSTNFLLFYKQAQQRHLRSATSARNIVRFLHAQTQINEFATTIKKLPT